MTVDVGFDVELAPGEIAALLGRSDARPERSRPPSPGPILVTGAGGSIGSLLVRRLAELGARVVALDRAEAGLFRLGLRLREAGHDGEVRLAVRDVGCRSLVDLIESEGIVSIVHAAAHKHVGLMEDDEGEAFRNNVEKTGLLLERAARSGVADFILISTDKAVDPVCTMGRSKAAAEGLVLDRAASAMRGRVLRLPNVLGSAGSVAQVFRRALLRADELVLRDARAERLYLGPEEAMACLCAVLTERAGGLRAPPAPPAIALLELARRAHRLWGRGPELAFRDVGLGPGERLHESLLGRGETARRLSAELMGITRSIDADADRRADGRL